MTMQFTRPITEDEIRAYEEDGVVCLRNILNKEWVKILQDAIEEVLNQPGPSGHDIAAGAASGKFGYDIFMWTFNQRFRRFQAKSPMPEWAAALMRSKKANLAVDAMFVKEPNTASHTPWHHDQPYLWMDGTQVCSFWTPLEFRHAGDRRHGMDSRLAPLGQVVPADGLRRPEVQRLSGRSL